MSKLFISYGLVLLCIVFLAYPAFALLPAIRDSLIAEDNLVENVTAAIFLISLFSSLYSFWRTRPQPYSLAFAFVALISLVGFLDEVSFGTRLFPLEIPMILGVRLDGIHDIFLILAIFLKRNWNLLVYGLIVVALLLPTIYLLNKYRSKFEATVYFLKSHAPYSYISYFVLFIFFATLLDVFPDIPVDILPIMSLGEEILELVAAISILYASFRPMAISR